MLMMPNSLDRQHNFRLLKLGLRCMESVHKEHNSCHPMRFCSTAAEHSRHAYVPSRRNILGSDDDRERWISRRTSSVLGLVQVM